MSVMIPPAIRYLGSKFLCVEWIIAHFPPHRAYCEPCGGAAAVLLVLTLALNLLASLTARKAGKER